MKPTTAILVCLTLLGAAIGAWAQDGTTKKRVFGNGVLSEYAALYDIDGSGNLSVDELQTLQADRQHQSRHDRARSRWDTNRDGRIDEAERRVAVADIRRRIEQRRLRRFAEVDVNSDNFLTISEFRGISAVNANDLVNPGIAVDLFKHLDHNNDDRISKEEFLRSLNSIRPLPPVGEPDPEPAPHETRDNNATPDQPANR